MVDPRRAGQGPQGSTHHALTAAARAAQGMVAAVPVEGLAVPGPGSAAADHDTIGDIASQQGRDLRSRCSRRRRETLLTIAADPKRLGAKIGITSVLHTWASAMTHHPHVHMIVPGGGISARWLASVDRRLGGAICYPCWCCSRLFRRLMLAKLAGRPLRPVELQFFADHARLADKARRLRPLG